MQSAFCDRHSYQHHREPVLLMIGFHRIEPQVHRRAIHSPGTGRKMGYFCNDNNGKQSFQDLSGRTVARIKKWKDGKNPYTDSSACGGSFVPRDY